MSYADIFWVNVVFWREIQSELEAGLLLRVWRLTGTKAVRKRWLWDGISTAFICKLKCNLVTIEAKKKKNTLNHQKTHPMKYSIIIGTYKQYCSQKCYKKKLFVFSLILYDFFSSLHSFMTFFFLSLSFFFFLLSFFASPFIFFHSLFLFSSSFFFIIW